METFSILLLLFAAFSTFDVIQSQQLTPSDDKMYLDTLESEIKKDVAEAKAELVRHAKEVEEDTRNYAKTKLTQNIFKALRVLAEKELEQIPMQYRIRQPRQDDGDESGGGGGSSGGDDEETAEGSSGGSGSSAEGGGSSTARTVPLIPVLAGILKSVFGGGENATTTPLNVTHTLQHATKLLFPLGNPFKNIIRNRRPTAAPATVIKYYPVPIYSAPPSTPQPTVRSIVKTTTPRLRLVGRVQRSVLDSLVSPSNSGVSEPVTPPTHVPILSKLIHPKPSTIYANMESLYAPAYSPFPILVKPNPESPSPVKVAAPPMIIYAPNYQPQQPIYAPNHPSSQPQLPALIPQPSILESSLTTTSKPKPPPKIDNFIPAFAETVAVPESKPVKIPTKTEAITVTIANVESSTKRTRVSTTTGTTETPKPGLIYVDSLARDVQTGLDGLVKNLPDILKGAKEAIGLLANLREIFGEEEDG